MFDFDYPVLLLIGVLVLILGYYVGIPLLCYQTQRMSGQPRYEEVRLDEIDEEVAESLMQATRPVIDLGFQEPLIFHTDDAVSNVDLYSIVLVDRTLGHVAVLAVIVGTLVPSNVKLIVEFSTSYESGESFDTLCSDVLPAFSPSPKSVLTHLIDPVSIPLLYRLHCHIVNKHSLTNPKVFAPGKALKYLTEEGYKKVFEEQEKRGILSKRGHEFRPTLLGAFIISWGVLFPFSWIRRLRLRQNQARLLAEYERDNPEES